MQEGVLYNTEYQTADMSGMGSCMDGGVMQDAMPGVVCPPVYSTM